MKTTPDLSRRTVARGVAWSAPIIAVGAPAPAVAASQPPSFSHITHFLWYMNNAPWCFSQDGMELNTVDSGTGVSFKNTKSSTRITGISATFYFAGSDLQWSAATGDSGCWTVPTQKGSAISLPLPTGGNGTFYPYVSSYTCGVTAAAGTTTLKPYRFRTQCLTKDDTSWSKYQVARRVAIATIDGAPTSTDTGTFTINS